MKRVFFIINCFSKGGGAEALLTLIVNNLNPQKYEIGVMEIIHDTIKKEPIHENVRMYPYYTLADAPDRKTRMYYVYHKWDQVINEYIPPDYDIYISFNYLKPSFLLPKGKKCIAWIHGDVYDLAADKMKEERLLQSKAFEKADKIVAISDITMQSLVDLFPEHKEKFVMLCNGIDVDSVRKKAKEMTDIRLEHPAILSIGRVEDNKNPLRLLKIFATYLDQEPGAHLYYLGYGDQCELVQQQAVEKGIDQSVHLLGYYDNPFPIVSQCDVVGMFSKSEGFPLALLESVALYKPFVSSLIGGARLLANVAGCGKVTESDDEAVDALSYYIKKDKTIVEKACEDTIKCFNLESYITQIEELLDSL